MFDWNGWYTSLYDAWFIFVDRMISVAPLLIGAGLILVLGSLLAMGLGEAVGAFAKNLKLDSLIEKTPLHHLFAVLGVKSSALIEEIVKWVILIVVFIAAADVAHLDQLNQFLNDVLHYLPNVFVAVLILVVASIVATFVGNLIQKTVSDDLGYYSGLSKGAIYTFAVLAALHELQISKPLIEILFTGIVAAFVLSFGLGGREVAGEIIRKFYNDFQSKNGKRK